MIKELDTYDWGQVFGYAAESGQEAYEKPCAVAGCRGIVLEDPFCREDVVRIIASEEGVNDEESWVIVVELKDGRFASIEAWCDFTGWDCQAGGASWVANSLSMIIAFGLSDHARDRLGDQLNERD